MLTIAVAFVLAYLFLHRESFAPWDEFKPKLRRGLSTVKSLIASPALARQHRPEPSLRYV